MRNLFQVFAKNPSYSIGLFIYKLLRKQVEKLANFAHKIQGKVRMVGVSLVNSNDN